MAPAEIPTTHDHGPSALLSARAACARNDWPGAFATLQNADATGDLDARGLELLAECARWTGHDDVIISALMRAQEIHTAAKDHEAAARTALALSFTHGDRGNRSLASSWWRRAGDLLADLPEGPSHALLTWFTARNHGDKGDRDAQDQAAQRSLEIARRHGNRDVEALALIERGHVATARGDWDAALEFIDQATALALGGEIGVLETGLVLCSAIFASRSRGEWDRACEWTESATRFVERTQVSYFPGVCRVHRAEVLRVRGALDAAEYESREAADYLGAVVPRWESYARAELGEILRRRGDHDGAMAAFERALELGWEPQPGLALLLLARDDADAAHRSLERFFAHPTPTLICESRIAVVAARVTAALAVGAHDVAESALRELAEQAERRSALPWDRATHLQARGEVAFATGGDPEPDVVAARLLWAELEAPYELATCRELLGRVLLAKGDRAGARLEGQIARRTFDSVGAAFDRDRVQRWLDDLDGDQPARPTKRMATRSASLRREGDTWAFEFAGKTVRLATSRGLEYLARLLGTPEENVWATDLAAGNAQCGTAPALLGDAGEVLDAGARASYRDRIADLQSELDDARECNDEGRIANARAEMDQLTRQLAAAVGLGGRERRVGSHVERARQSVTKAIRGVLRKVAEEHAELGSYLEATIRTGTACRFEPDPRDPVTWQVVCD